MQLRAFLCGTAMALCVPAVAADPILSLQWFDPAGDPVAVGDVVSVKLSFASSGAWTATWMADPGHLFTGNTRFNLNLFDTALGDLASALAPQLSLDGFHDFGAGSASEFSYSGQSSFLSNWHVGDVVSTGNTSNFISGLVDLGGSNGRDNLVTQATIVGSVPEPGSFALVGLGLGLLALRPLRRR